MKIHEASEIVRKPQELSGSIMKGPKASGIVRKAQEDSEGICSGVEV